MDTNMVFAHNSIQDFHFYHITDLDHQFPTSFLYVSSQYVIPVFGNPHDMTG